MEERNLGLSSPPRALQEFTKTLNVFRELKITKVY